jgi:hypothetical protein
MVEIIVYPDVLAEGLDYLRDQFAIRDDAFADGLTLGSYIPDTRPALPFIWLRRVGGFKTGRATDRARLDCHVYHQDEAQAHDLTQLTRGLILAWPYIDGTVAKGASEFSGPGPVPDDLWPEAARWYFTVEITLRGHAAGVPS